MKEKVKRLCKEKGITLKDLAAQIGIARESLTRALDGNPTLSTLQGIATALEVELYELFTDLNLKEMIQNKSFRGVIWIGDKPTLINSIKDLEDLIRLVKATQS